MTRNKQWDSLLIKIEECKNDIQYIQNNASDIPMIEIDIALEKLSSIYDRLLSLKLGAASTEEIVFFAKNSSLIKKIIDDSVFNNEHNKNNSTSNNQAKEIEDESKNVVVEQNVQHQKNNENIDNVQPTVTEKNKLKTEQKQNKNNKTLAETLKKETNLTVADMMTKLYKKKDIATLQQLKPIKDLKQAISINDKIMFIREIFSNDVDKYNHTLNAINSCQNLNEALEILEQTVEINSENSVMQYLLELLYRRYM